MSVRKNSRSFQVRKAAERDADSYLRPPHKLNKADSRFRVILAFRAGADWERRRWMKYARFTCQPETMLMVRRMKGQPQDPGLHRLSALVGVPNGEFPRPWPDKYPDPEHPTGTALKAGAS